MVEKRLSDFSLGELNAELHRRHMHILGDQRIGVSVGRAICVECGGEGRIKDYYYDLMTCRRCAGEGTITTIRTTPTPSAS